MTSPDPSSPPSAAAAATSDEIVRLAPEILAFLTHHAGDPHRGAELAQDALATAFRKAGDVRDPSAVRPWLFRIAVNRFHDFVRRERPRDRTTELSDRPDRSAAASPEAAALRRETEDVLRAAVAALPERQRAVFMLSGVEGLDHAGIATELDLSPGAVKTALYHAREKLRVVVGRYLGLEGAGEDRTP